VIVWTLVLAALGFGLLVTALLTGSVIWAWACIAACAGGAAALLFGALRRSGGERPARGPDRPELPARPAPRAPDWDRGTDLIRPPVQKDFRRPDRLDDNWR
jgi:hypothetical protein